MVELFAIAGAGQNDAVALKAAKPRANANVTTVLFFMLFPFRFLVLPAATARTHIGAQDQLLKRSKSGFIFIST